MKKALYSLIFTLFVVLLSCGEQNSQSVVRGTGGAPLQKINADLVKLTVDSLNMALLNRDRKTLISICAAELSYGHSSGAVQDRQTFVDDVVNGPFAFLSIETENQKITTTEDMAIVRHVFQAKGLNNGDTVDVRIGNAQLYKLYPNGHLRLVLRQAFKL
ncbi:MAG: nuclear transport factor 2 family protein [Imperialibacter sp.]